MKTLPKWLNTPIKNLTIQDAIEAHEAGVSFECGDGRLQRTVGDVKKHILNVLERKE
jgi:hypothetical protein